MPRLGHREIPSLEVGALFGPLQAVPLTVELIDEYFWDHSWTFELIDEYFWSQIGAQKYSSINSKVPGWSQKYSSINSKVAEWGPLN